jgi:predicted nucleic acid-binding protein
MWVPFFNRPQSPVKRAIDELLDEDRAALIGPIVAEILCGFRHDAQADWVASVLRGVRYLELSWNDWRAAAQLSRQLAAQGHQLPLSDLALAAVARHRDCWIYTTDPHFDLLPQVRRYSLP